MTKLLSTTALVVALGFPAMTLAQDTNTTTNAETQQQNGQTSGFLSQRGQADLYASDLMGMDVYARGGSTDDSSDDEAASQDEASDNMDGSDGMGTMNRADLDDMDNIGQINEVLLSRDGQVQALVIGVGGFLGMGEQDVAVTMEQITFASDADDGSQMYIIVNTNEDMLREAPAYDRTASMSGSGADDENRPMSRDDAANDNETDRTTTGSDTAQTGDDAERMEERETFAAPDMEREGYSRVEAQDVSTDMLMDQTVYDMNDNDVGDVTDMIIDDDGRITNIIIDFGGFLGIGSSQASLQFDELTILTTDGYDDVRLYVDATKEQIQELPRYTASN